MSARSLAFGLRVGTSVLPLLLSLAAESSGLTWRPAWNTTLDQVQGRSSLKGACIREGTLYVTAVVTGGGFPDPTPILYSLPLGTAAPPAATRLWKGRTVSPEGGLSNPTCGQEGISFALREAQGETRLVHVTPEGRSEQTRLVSGPSSLEIVALRARDEGEWLLATSLSDRLFLARAKGVTEEIAVPGAAAEEVVIDLCTAAGRFALLTHTQTDAPVGLLKLREWEPTSDKVITRELRGSFGGLLCSPGGEMEVFHLQPQGPASSYALARYGPGLSGPKTEIVDSAQLASPNASGSWTDAGSEWGVANLKKPTVYEAPRGERPRLAWRETDERWGATITPPALAPVDDGSIAVVYEAYDRSSKDLPVVLRAVRLTR